MKNRYLPAALILILLIAAQAAWAVCLLKLSDWRYPYHVDCIYRAMNAYKWSCAPFFTWDAAKFPLESWIYGGALMICNRIWLVLPAANLAFAAGIGLLLYRLSRVFSGESRSALLVLPLCLFIPDFLLATVGVMGEIILAFLVLAGLTCWIDFRRDSRWGRLYVAALFFLLASAIRPEGWLFVAGFLGLVGLAASADKGLPQNRRIHLIAAGAFAAAFIPVFLIYSLKTTGRFYYFMQHYVEGLPISGDKVLVWGNVPLPFVLPRLWRYPYFLFRLQPVLIVLGIAGAVIILAEKRRWGKEYLGFLLVAFALFLLKAVLVGTSYTPGRTILFFAFGLAPPAAVFLKSLINRRRIFGGLAVVLVAGQVWLNFPDALKRMEHYRTWLDHTGRIDLLALKVLKLDKSLAFLSGGTNVLAEVGTLDPIPAEYNLFYYFPENLTFDRASHVSYKTRKDLFVRPFDQTYLGLGAERIKPRGPSLFDWEIGEIGDILRTRNVRAVITHTEENTKKMESLTGSRPIEVHKYRLFLLEDSQPNPAF